MTLNNLGIRLSETGDRAGALTATREALELRRSLAAQDPVFTDGLITSLRSAARLLADDGEADAAHGLWATTITSLHADGAIGVAAHIAATWAAWELGGPHLDGHLDAVEAALDHLLVDTAPPITAEQARLVGQVRRAATRLVDDHGTPAQRARWQPRPATGEITPLLDLDPYPATLALLDSTTPLNQLDDALDHAWFLHPRHRTLVALFIAFEALATGEDPDTTDRHLLDATTIAHDLRAQRHAIDQLVTALAALDHRDDISLTTALDQLPATIEALRSPVHDALAPSSSSSASTSHPTPTHKPTPSPSWPDSTHPPSAPPPTTSAARSAMPPPGSSTPSNTSAAPISPTPASSSAPTPSPRPTTSPSPLPPPSSPTPTPTCPTPSPSPRACTLPSPTPTTATTTSKPSPSSSPSRPSPRHRPPMPPPTSPAEVRRRPHEGRSIRHEQLKAGTVPADQEVTTMGRNHERLEAPNRSELKPKKGEKVARGIGRTAIKGSKR